MRTAILLLWSCAAAAQTTTVTGTMTDAAGDLLSGSCSIQAIELFSAAGLACHRRADGGKFLRQAHSLRLWRPPTARRPQVSTTK